jgi:threonine dehydrogenase-like Zn-dependent dehydrogenase
MGDVSKQTMRAARLHGKGSIKIDEIALPVPKDNQVVVDVEWCGICGSDLHAYIAPSSMTAESLPIALGHEISGRVRNPPSSSSLKDGEAVFVDPRGKGWHDSTTTLTHPLT